MTDLTAQPGIPDVIVVMGVSGSGKSTVAKGIARTMGWDFAEGDEFHPKANVDKMADGVPLTDDDRWPWLASSATGSPRGSSGRSRRSSRARP